MRTDSVPRWMGPTDSWREALRTAAIVFAAFSGLHVLMGALSPTPFESAKLLQAAMLGLAVGFLRRAAPLSERLLRAVAPEQLRVTLSALGIAAVFFGLGMILSIGEGEPAPLLEGWWVALCLLFGFVLATIGAAEKEAGPEDSARR